VSIPLIPIYPWFCIHPSHSKLPLVSQSVPLTPSYRWFCYLSLHSCTTNSIWATHVTNWVF
jgi:hypothetical protein